MSSTALPAHLCSATVNYESINAIVIADGEHYPAVIIDLITALKREGWDIRGVALVGGSEKLREAPNYGVPHVSGDVPAIVVVNALESFGGSWVIDLSDEPALVFEQRARVIGAVAAANAGYIGSELVIHSPTFSPCNVPSIAVIGTGKRIGKTAIAGHLARVVDKALDGEVVVVAMGRGGPGDPVVVPKGDGAVTVERLLEISRSGMHAASDYLEDAALTGCTTVGCRRGGGGVLGVPVTSNVPAGGVVAENLGAAVVIYEGSGSCIPPVDVNRTLLIASTERPRDLFEDFGSYRIGRADVVLVVGDDASVGEAAVARLAIEYPRVKAYAVALRPYAMDDLTNRKVAVFTTAPEFTAGHYRALVKDSEATLASISHSLAHRPTLRDDVAKAISLGVDTFAVEVKAAAIDVVAEVASENAIDVVLLDNRPECHRSDITIDDVLRDFALGHKLQRI